MPELLTTREELLAAVSGFSAEQQVGITGISCNAGRSYLVHPGHSYLLAQMAEVFPKTILFVLDTTPGSADPDTRISNFTSAKNYSLLNCDYVYIHKAALSTSIEQPMPLEDMSSPPVVQLMADIMNLPLRERTEYAAALQKYFFYNTHPNYCTRWNPVWDLMAEIGTLRTVVTCKGNKDILSDVAVWGQGVGNSGYLSSLSGIAGMRSNLKRWLFASGYLPDSSLMGTAYAADKTSPAVNHPFSYVRSWNLSGYTMATLSNAIAERLSPNQTMALVTVDGRTPTDSDLENGRVVLLLVTPSYAGNPMGAIEQLWLNFPSTSVYQKWPTSEFLANKVSTSFLDYVASKQAEYSADFVSSPSTFADKMVAALKERFTSLRA
jgi:hypothetical protein